MKKIAIVCCYNNKEIFDSMLLDGIKRQKNIEIEEFFYYNEFSCAALAYNKAIEKAKSKVIVFVHQDIRFDDDSFLEDLYDTVESNKHALYGLCGAIGTKAGTKIISNVYHGLLRTNIGIKAETAEEVQGLDEIFVAMHIDLAKDLRFDVSVVDGWHMYVENMCLDAIEKGYKLIVYPGFATHKNIEEMPGYMMAYKLFPKEFFDYLWRVRKKHKDKIKKIVCPCITISTSSVKFYPLFLFYKYETIFRKHLRKISMKL